ncbi:MAG: glycosyltransferase [Bacteroidetes bacterium]|nr:glycosyltransferase [Bacteroidota bacterium]
MRYNILFLTKWYPNRFDPQLGVFIRKHAQAVSDYCNVVVLYTCADSSIKINYETTISTQHGFTEIVVYYKKNKFLFKIFLNIYRYFKANLIGLRIAQNSLGVIDLLHVNVLNRPGLIALIIRKLKGIPYIVTEHWTGYISGNYRKSNFLKKWLTKKIIYNASAVTTVSNNLKQTMLSLGLTNNYTIIPNVIESIALQTTETLNSNSKTKILTIADLLDVHKNISGIIKAIATVSKTNPNIEYHIVGDGPDKLMLKVLSDTLKLTDKFIFFHGRQSNEYVYDLFKQIDFVVINSNYETFSVVAAESLANGKPLITTICGGPEEFVTSDHGILIEKNNQEQLEEAILKMLLIYKNYDAQQLNSYITQKFNYQTIGKLFYEIYKPII